MLNMNGLTSKRNTTQVTTVPKVSKLLLPLLVCECPLRRPLSASTILAEDTTTFFVAAPPQFIHLVYMVWFFLISLPAGCSELIAMFVSVIRLNSEAAASVSRMPTSSTAIRFLRVELSIFPLLAKYAFFIRFILTSFTVPTERGEAVRSILAFVKHLLVSKVPTNFTPSEMWERDQKPMLRRPVFRVRTFLASRGALQATFAAFCERRQRFYFRAFSAPPRVDLIRHSTAIIPQRLVFREGVAWDF
jgi:hypothetical protein